MTTDWMITAYRPYSEKIPMVWKFMKPKHWIVAVEGLKAPMKPHMQIRLKTSRTEKEVKKWVKSMSAWLGGVDIRKAEDKDIKEWQYERKENVYRCSWDRPENRECRYGKPQGNQLVFLDHLRTQNNRTITVWYNKEGGAGKSWLCRHLFERGNCTYLLVSGKNVDRIIKDAVSAYNYSESIIIDLPRSHRWTIEDCEVLEHLKDGLIRDDRYGNRTININGVKVGVMTNTKPKLDGLSKDRWDIIET